MHRFIFFALLVLGLSPVGANAQTQTTGRTTCRVVLGQLTCDSQSQTTVTRPSCSLTCALVAARVGYADGQQQRIQADAAAAREDLEIQRLQAQLARLRAQDNAESVARDNSDVRAQAQRELFNAKAVAVARRFVDSTNLPLYAGHRTSRELGAEVSARLDLVWRADPTASSAAIADAVQPIFASFGTRNEGFRTRFMRVLATGSRAAGIAVGSARYDTLWTAMADRAVLIAADDLDSPIDSIGKALAPVVDSAYRAGLQRKSKRARRDSLANDSGERLHELAELARNYGKKP